MKNLTFEEFTSRDWPLPLRPNFDKGGAITTLEKGSNTDWRALPVEWEINLPETAYAERLSAYYFENGIKRIAAFSPPSFSSGNASEILVGEATAKNFLQAESVFALRVYTIVPDSGGGQLFSDGDYYTVFTGPAGFLKQILRISESEAWQKFRQYMDSYGSSSIESVLLMRVLKICEAFSARQ